MFRTQVQLTDEQLRGLRRLAQDQGVSMAEIVRRFVDQGLTDQPRLRRQLYSRASSLIGRFPDRESASDLATGHDRFLQEAFE